MAENQETLTKIAEQLMKHNSQTIQELLSQLNSPKQPAELRSDTEELT